MAVAKRVNSGVIVVLQGPEIVAYMISGSGCYLSQPRSTFETVSGCHVSIFQACRSTLNDLIDLARLNGISAPSKLMEKLSRQVFSSIKLLVSCLGSSLGSSLGSRV